MFTDNNILEIQNRGVKVENVEKQIQRFKTGFMPINITQPAVVKNGIIKLEKKEALKYIKLYDKKIKYKQVSKFVPASGAASRMFKMLFQILEEYDGTEESYKKLFSKTGMHTPKSFFENLHSFAFYNSLKDCIAANGKQLSELLEKKDYKTILEYFLTEKGLNYGNLPKGMLLFHAYETDNRTALEEHLVEGAVYAKNYNGDVHIHFTVSPEFIEGFKKVVTETKQKYQEQYQVKYYITYSVQKPSTDTIAVTETNEPFLNKDNTLLFRPAGHGALIENLHDLDFDIIFVKNIDNIVPDSYKTDTVFYKKALGGVLIHYQSTLFKLYTKLKKSKHLSVLKLRSIVKLFTEELYFKFPEGFDKWPRNDAKEYILQLLNRPIRVCGMVKNEGEPGGGPFFVREVDSSQTLQIIEMAQVDSNSKEQLEIAKNATHFNPVDLVCGLKDYQDKKFNLLDFVDQEAGIITVKSKDGKALKALELPGLWNGAMANWTTIFVEVPVSTFNPVKEVTDLLRKEHKQK